MLNNCNITIYCDILWNLGWYRFRLGTGKFGRYQTGTAIFLMLNLGFMKSYLNLYRFTDKNLILKCHFNGYFRVFLSKMGTLNLSHFDQREKTSRGS